MLLLALPALAAPFVGAVVDASVPLSEDYVRPGPLFGAYAGMTFPRMGFEVRGTWGSGTGDLAYRLWTARVDGLHLFRPDARIDPLLVYGLGYRAASFPSSADRAAARRAGVMASPGLVGFGEVGGGLIVRLVGPLHVRLDTRAWVGAGFEDFEDRPFVGVDALLGLELRPAGRADRDGDGLLDRDDACPDQPEDFDRLLDHDGCPETDVDGDGILDENDRCPTRPETANGYYDEDGCPDVVP